MSWRKPHEFKVNDVLILGGNWAIKILNLDPFKSYLIENYGSRVRYEWTENFLLSQQEAELCPLDILNQLFLVD